MRQIPAAKTQKRRSIMAGRLLGLMLCVWALILTGPSGLKAATVGRFVQVEGQVDLLKGGKLPLTPAKVQQAVDQGDVVRTKSNSRAQIQFVDETVLSIGPSSRVAIEDYVFDADKGQRSAVIEMFRGLVQTTVKKIYQMDEPDFVVKTHTATLGVRGTKWYTQILPTSTDVYTEEAGQVSALDYKPSPQAGLEVKNRFPEVIGTVILKAMQFTRVGVDMAPTVPVNITPEDLKYLEAWLNLEGEADATSETPESFGARDSLVEDPAITGPTPSTADYQSPPTGGLSTVPTIYSTSTRDTSVISPNYLPSTSTLDSPAQYFFSGLYVPPQVAPTSSSSLSGSSSPQPQTFYFTQTWFGTFVFQSQYPFTSGTVQAWGWGQRTGVYDGYYSATASHLRLPPAGGTFGNSFLPGTSTGTMSGSVTGNLGGTLTGTMTFTGSLAIGGTFEYSGTVNLEPSGRMVFNYSGTRTNADGSSAGTTQNGEMTFLPGTYFSQTVASASYQQVSFAPHYSSTIFSDGVFTGTREGYAPGSFRGSFSVQTSTGILGQYDASDTGTLDITMEGVVSGSPEGTMTGAMTATARDSSTGEIDSVVGGPVMAYPDGTMVTELYGSRNLGAGNYEVEQGMWIQTSDPNAVPFTTTFVGSMDPMASSPPYNTGTFTGRGFGFGEAEGLGGGAYVGTFSGTATAPDNTFAPSGNPNQISFTIAGVGRLAGPEGPWTGQVFANGQWAQHAWLSASTTPGTFTLQPYDGTATLTLNNLWKEATSSGSVGGTITTTINTAPGEFFQQVAGPGSVTYTSNDSTDYTVQNIQLTDKTPIYGTGTLGNFAVTDFTGTGRVLSGDINVFPDRVISSNTMIYSHGVIGPGGTGAMELTVVGIWPNGADTDWYRLRGTAVQTSGANLQGINLVGNSSVGATRIPVQRVLQYQQLPWSPEVIIGGQIQAAN